MTLDKTSLIKQVIDAPRTDQRIPVVVLLGANLELVFEQLVSQFNASESACLAVLGTGSLPSGWPGRLRFFQIRDDEVLSAQGCLCCSMKSELAMVLSQLFLNILRRREAPVAAVLVVTQANVADSLEQTLRHAPFLRQRYRLAACLPLTQA